MAKPLPKELRERALKALEEGDTIRDVAETFSIGTATVKVWSRRLRELGTLEPSPRRNGPLPFADDLRLALLRELVDAHPDWTQDQFAAAWSERCGVAVSHDTVRRMLKKMGYTRKKGP